MSCAERQIGSKQDYAVCGETEGTRFAFVADGHGTSKCIDFLRSIDPVSIATAENPPDFIFELLQSIGNTFQSGFTFTFARIVHNKIQVWNVGDSETHVFLDGALVYKTPAHSFLNDAELERTKHLVSVVNPTKAPFPVSDGRVELVLSPTGMFTTGENLVMTMAFGHNNMTGLVPSFWERDVGAESIRIVGGSDGFFDMLVPIHAGTADELADAAVERWQQQWEFFDGKNVVMTNYGGGYDDVAVFVL